MHWLLVSVIVALAVASHDAWVKKHFSHLSVSEMLAMPLFYSLPFFMIVMPFVPVPVIDRGFYGSFAACLPINVLASFLYTKAIKISPLSLTVPYLAFTPPFAMVTGYLFLHETPGIWAGVGIVATCIGSYVLNIEPDRQGLLAPVKAVFNETGSWMMLIVAFLFAFTVVVGKKAIVHSSPLFFTMVFFSIHNLIVLGILAVTGKIRIHTFAGNFRKGLVAGGLLFIHVLLHGFAISWTQAAYMVSIKRLSILFSIIYGRMFFEERRMVVRLVGATFMLGGAVLIVLKE
ncbi:MAG: DMT family transporter [Desulfobacterales bacterium]|jgi:drug/metabolite transporter (DMT)-like permease|nr:DMT family transporter [Desulfobacterales bacterium]